MVRIHVGQPLQINDCVDCARAKNEKGRYDDEIPTRNSFDAAAQNEFVVIVRRFEGAGLPRDQGYNSLSMSV
jgi:hypothetical protein